MTAATGAPLPHIGVDFATTALLALAQKATPGKAKECAASPVLLDRFGGEEGLKSSEVGFHPNATNGEVVRDI